MYKLPPGVPKAPKELFEEPTSKHYKQLTGKSLNSPGLHRAPRGLLAKSICKNPSYPETPKGPRELPKTFCKPDPAWPMRPTTRDASLLECVGTTRATRAPTTASAKHSSRRLPMRHHWLRAPLSANQHHKRWTWTRQLSPTGSCVHMLSNMACKTMEASN